MKGVQCYELFGGIALKNDTFSFHDTELTQKEKLYQNNFTGSMPLLTPNHSFRTCGGPEAVTSATTTKKCCGKTSSGGQEGYILKTH